MRPDEVFSHVRLILAWARRVLENAQRPVTSAFSDRKLWQSVFSVAV